MPTKKHKLTKKHRVLWDTATGEIVAEVHDETAKSTTECWRDGVESFESDDSAAVESKIKDDGLKSKESDDERK